MKFHAPSFLWQLKRRFDVSFDVYDHNLIAYILTDNKYFTERICKGLIAEALIDSLDAPLAAPDGPRQRSLLDAPIDTHIGALQAALSDRNDYLAFRLISTVAGERYEWRVDMRRLQEMIADVRRQCDAELCKELIRGDLFISDRLLTKKLLRSVGVAFSDRRIRDVMRSLELQGVIRGNGHLRTMGRDVLI
jgi:hypothetical protein